MQHYAATAALQGYAYAAVGIKSPLDKVLSGPLLYRRESEMWTGKVPSESLESINLFLLVITIFGSIKFSFSEKATKICAIFLMVLMFTKYISKP